MTGDRPARGMLDTNILILRRWIDPAELPDEMAISAITLAELSAGPHEVRRSDEQDRYDENAERARRLDVLQRAESEFDHVPFDAEAARIYGRVTAAVITSGRKPRRRAADLMIASTAIAEQLALFTTNPDDFAGLETLISIVPVTRPAVPKNSRSARQPALVSNLVCTGWSAWPAISPQIVPPALHTGTLFRLTHSCLNAVEQLLRA